jgi:hypothetical protein
MAVLTVAVLGLTEVGENGLGYDLLGGLVLVPVLSKSEIKKQKSKAGFQI